MFSEVGVVKLQEIVGVQSKRIQPYGQCITAVKHSGDTA